MSHESSRRFLILLVTLGLGACSASSDKNATGGGDNNAGNAGEAGASGGGANGSAGNNSNTSGGDGGGSGKTCYDNDSDTFGLNCAAGPDCDDANPALGGYEVCDGKDNDCDGKADDFIADVCVTCNLQCVPVNEPPNDSGFTPIAEKAPGDAEDVIIDKDGALTLDRDESQAHAVWVANTDDFLDDNTYAKYLRGTVSKLDSKTNRELARYLSIRPADVAGLTMGDRAPLPSRTAVDQRFDAYVANRAHLQGTNGQPTITKFANDEKHCIDRNLNGMIETSRDINRDGKISLAPADLEFVGADDECILWTKPVGALNSTARALAVGIAPPDAEVGNLFVGLFHGKQACRLSADTGETIKCTPTPDFNSYGAASDAKGRVWYISRSDNGNDLGFLLNDTWTQITGTPACGTNTNPTGYGITVDVQNRVYLAMANCTDKQVYRYDHDNGGVWTQVAVPGGGTGRGVAADRTHLWVAVSHDSPDFKGTQGNRIEQFDLATLKYVATHRMPHGRYPVGVGVSFDGSIWAINQGHGGASDPFAGSNDGIATRLDPAIADGQDGHWIEWPVGRGPYTYSDFIGFGLNTFADPKGFYRFIVEGCLGQNTNWRGVQIDAETPKGTSVKIRVRSAGTKDALAAAEWHGPFDPPAALTDVPSGAILEVEVVLATDDQSVAPRVFGVEIIKECENVIQ